MATKPEKDAAENPPIPTTSGVRGSVHAPPTNAFKPGNPGSKGRPPLPKSLKEVLRIDSIDLYNEAKRLYASLRDGGHYGPAVTLLLGLIRKTIPDTQTLLVGGAEDAPALTLKVNTSKLTDAQLETVKGVIQAAEPATPPLDS